MSLRKLAYLAMVASLTALIAFTLGCAPEYEVKVQADPEDAGKVTGEGTYEEGEEAKIEAEPKDGYAFEKWEENGEKITSDKDYNLEVSEDITLEAQFEKKEHEVSLVPSDEEKGEVSGSGTYEDGEEVTIEAEPADYFKFDYWQDEEGEKVNNDKSYEFQVEEAHDLVANFKLNLEDVIELSDGIEITLKDVWEQLIEHTSNLGEPQSYLNEVEVRETNKENKKSVHFGNGGLYNPSLVGYVDTKTSEINLIGSANRFNMIDLYWSPTEDYLVYDYTSTGTGFHHLHFYNVEKDEVMEITQMEKFKEKYDREQSTIIHNMKWSEDGEELYFEVECGRDDEITSWIFNV